MSVGFALIVGLVIVGGLALLVPTETLVTANASTPAGRALMRRFISRSRRFRLVGGLIGIGISLVITATRSDASGSITIGLLPALAGAVAGSIVAEAFRTRPVRGPRTASLGIRQDVDYSDPTADVREGIIAVIATGIALAAVAQGTWGAVGLFVVILSAGVLRRWAQHRVALRGRPALDPDLARADDQVRRMAVRNGLARPMVTLMALLASTQAALLGAGYEEASMPGQVAGLLSLALAVVGVVWWWTNRNFGSPSINRGRKTSMALLAAAVVGVVVVTLLARFLP
jgi:hypothetical protein